MTHLETTMMNSGPARFVKRRICPKKFCFDTSAVCKNIKVNGIHHQQDGI